MSYNFPFKQNDIIIELGGGTKPYFRPNVDVRKEENVDIVADFNEPLPIENNKYDGVFSKFCIEHISWRKVKLFLSEVFRILKKDGKAVFVTANTESQMKWVLEHEEWDDDCSCIIFGDQDYEANAHKNSLNPKYAIKLMTDIGFSNIIVLPFGELGTDMVIEATKKIEIKDDNTENTERKQLFDKYYFNGGGKVGGYAREGYWDYPVHWVTFNKLMEEKPESVLEIGCARGYLLKRFESHGIPAKGLEISKHCYLTRVTDAVNEFDICQTPWPFEDKQFDLCYSVAVMEHIPEEHLPAIFKEIDRVSKRGLHGVDFGEQDDGFDQTHCTLKDKDWWEKIASNTQKIVNKEYLEEGSVALNFPHGDNKVKLNIGSFTTMFHNNWINIDILNASDFANRHFYKFLQQDVSKKILFNDGVVDYIVSSHMLEHLTREQGLNFLNECYRILKKGGVARISLPDAEKLISYYNNKKLEIFDEINDGCAASPFQSGKLWALLFEGHRIALDFEALKQMGESAGFKVERKEFNKGTQQIISETMDFLPELSLFVELYKV